MSAGCPLNATAGTTGSQCTFAMLWNGADITNVGSRSGVGIRRRIFTTSQNGVFGPTVDQLIAGQSPFRVALWPPQTSGVSTAVAPGQRHRPGLVRRGDGPAARQREPDRRRVRQAAHRLQGLHGRSAARQLPAAAAPPTPPPTSGFTLAQLQRARREARETLLAFLAGATFLTTAAGNPKRVLAASGPYTAGDILYVARTSILAESTVATPAVVGRRRRGA
jgi:hypothetical protein